jgi:hypothetical protein
MPDPNATSISAPGISTLDDDTDEFEDYEGFSYDDSLDELDAEEQELVNNSIDAQEQVGGGYSLRAKIVASPRANRTALQAQEQCWVSQAHASALESQSAGTGASASMS